MKRPSFQFYPGDWLRSTDLRSCSIGARGLWMDMLCLMHEGTPYGYLKVKDKVITDLQLVRMTGGDLGEVKEFLAELEESGVLSRSEDGCIFSRRMVKDEEMRLKRAAGGKEGGNPKLGIDYNKPGYVYAMLRSSDGAVKIAISQDPSKRLYKIKAQYPKDEISVIGKLFVANMGSVEAALHSEFQHCKSGEWFGLTEGEKDILLNIHLKENSKAHQTPSSSSSSSIKTKNNSAISFPEFWNLWPSTDRKTQKAKCLEKWKSKNLDSIAHEIFTHVKALKETEKWRSGYEPAPLTYLNGNQWEDGLPEISRQKQMIQTIDNPFEGCLPCE